MTPCQPPWKPRPSQISGLTEGNWNEFSWVTLPFVVEIGSGVPHRKLALEIRHHDLAGNNNGFCFGYDSSVSSGEVISLPEGKQLNLHLIWKHVVS